MVTIPDFRIFDDSSVTVVEITSEEEQSLVDNSFSAWGAKASAWVDPVPCSSAMNDRVALMCM
jgi:hypothetical protein